MSSPDTVLVGAAARLAHEIRNSLAGIAGALDVLSDRMPQEAELESVVRRIRGEVTRIDESVGELSAFAASPRAVLKRKDLHGVIDDALRTTGVAAELRVERDYDANLPPLALDAKLMGEALRRLFRNASDAMPAGGVLTVRTSRDRHGVRVAIRDTGVGVHEQDIASLFEPFYSKKTRGLGLGLAIARRLVEAHGGTLSVAPLGDSGAEFTILLPVSS